jgi:hypothetical protein
MAIPKNDFRKIDLSQIEVSKKLKIGEVTASRCILPHNLIFLQTRFLPFRLLHLARPSGLLESPSKNLLRSHQANSQANPPWLVQGLCPPNLG